jgi:hypothetical protein
MGFGSGQLPNIRRDFGALLAKQRDVHVQRYSTGRNPSLLQRQAEDEAHRQLSGPVGMLRRGAGRRGLAVERANEAMRRCPDQSIALAKSRGCWPQNGNCQLEVYCVESPGSCGRALCNRRNIPCLKDGQYVYWDLAGCGSIEPVDKSDGLDREW